LVGLETLGAALLVFLAIAAAASAKFISFEKVVGRRPVPCHPDTGFSGGCPSGNPFAVGTGWYRVSERFIFDSADPHHVHDPPQGVTHTDVIDGGEVVHLGDKIAFQVQNYRLGPGGDPANVSFRWTQHPEAALSEAGPGCDADPHRYYCVLRAKSPTHGYGRVALEDSNPDDTAMQPFAVVRQFVFAVGVFQGTPGQPPSSLDGEQNVPATLIELDRKGRKVAERHVRTDDNGAYQVLLDRPGTVVAFLPHGSDDALCYNGKRVRFGGRLACKSKLREKGSLGGEAGATFILKGSG
jgi:hypothetical protein